MHSVCVLRRCQKLSAKGSSYNYRSLSLFGGSQNAPANAELSEQLEHQNFLFDVKKKQVMSRMVPRIEKIQVDYVGHALTSSATMFMNKNLSTPHNCAMHISKTVADQAVIAKITPKSKKQQTEMLTLPNPEENSKLLKASSASSEIANSETSQYWDMHFPIPFDCTIEFLNFKAASLEDLKRVNKAYWRSSAVLLGATMSRAFKQKHSVGLLQIPQVSVESGAFCYDVELLDESLAEWQPSHDNLVHLTKLSRSIIAACDRFDRLQVDVATARQIFEGDTWRLDRLRGLEAWSPVSLYRIGDFIELVDGPLISNVSHFYHYVVTALHKLEDGSGRSLRRVQGISLPKPLTVHHSVWTMIENRARKLVREDLPQGVVRSEQDEKLDLLKHESIEDDTKVYTRSTGQWQPDQFKKLESSPSSFV